jgi:hypothetical protein
MWAVRPIALIADAILIGGAPIILLDEIENAGIFKQEVIRLIQDPARLLCLSLTTRSSPS